MKNEKGFTLIEIIAVLVILGILAAVAIPKFINLQDDAKNAATSGAIGAASANVQSAYSRLIVAGTQVTDNAIVLTSLNTASNNYTTVGDFTVTYTASGTTGITITVTAPTDKIGATPAKTIVLF